MAGGGVVYLWLQHWINIQSSTLNFWTTRPAVLRINKPYKTWKISDQVGQSNSVPWLMPSLPCVLIAYYRLQKIIFSIQKGYLNASAVETVSGGMHNQPLRYTSRGNWETSRDRGRCNSLTASRKLQVVICMELEANMVLCLRGKHLTGLTVPSPELLITYCGVSFKANCSVNYDNKRIQARSRKTLWRRCWSTLCSQKCWRYCSSLGWLRAFCKNWFPTSQTCISPP